MNKMNNKGFTLVELIATIVLLSLVMGLGAYSITAVIKKTREKDYQLLIENVNNAVELYYQECRFVSDNCADEITLGYLVTNGYLKGNGTNSDDSLTLVNPNDGKNITGCVIKYTYNGEMELVAVNPTGSCPATY